MTISAIADATGRKSTIRRCSGLDSFCFWLLSRFTSCPVICRGHHGFMDRRSSKHTNRKIFMIKAELISPDALRIVVPVKLKADDFRKIAPQVDSIIHRFGKIRLLIDASQFAGWENIAAFENHAAFVKSHQHKVDRIAVIVAHDWQHWLVGMVRTFVHPDVKAYGQGQESEALQWIAAP
jgi:stage II sporulation SpoAA-like protein